MQGEWARRGVSETAFRLLPKIGGRLNPGLIAKAVLPLARRLHADHPFDLVDAQFFYPDGPAAMIIARELGLPFSVKARGADIHYWGARAYGRDALLETAREAAGVLAVCAALADDMATRGMARGTITVHYTGLERDPGSVTHLTLTTTSSCRISGAARGITKKSS